MAGDVINNNTNKASITDGVVIDETEQKKILSASPHEIRQMLQVIQNDILPKTRDGVANGNKVFGAAILNPNFKCVCADTNAEATMGPLFHGEIKCIYAWSKQTPPQQRGPVAQSSIFLSTHEPCCMCISSIVWSGFTKVYYLFPYAITTKQGIPHDVNTMHELWGVNTYRKQNKYCSTGCIVDLIESLPDEDEKKDLDQLCKSIMDEYEKLSRKYHSEKGSNENNSLVLG
mmetsp:Transcript_40270/g.61088  ORF Transcript_40270/g.61088 Transcript_40270/m.61088 type:complete len:231 (-) Transcript_40270:613-1305(-)